MKLHIIKQAESFLGKAKKSGRVAYCETEKWKWRGKQVNPKKRVEYSYTKDYLTKLL